MTTSNRPQATSLMSSLSLARGRAYAECLEEFARSLGITEQTAHEYEIRTWAGAEPVTEVLHRGIKIGEITTLWKQDKSGFRFIVECRPTAD